MTRLRVALALLSIGLALPVGFLVARALQSAELERRVRYDAVTERIFDEMERTLSDFLAREEARPPDEYRFYRSDTGGRAPSVRSPLSRPVDEPFVIAHFEITPEGGLRTPLRPLDEAAAMRSGDWPAAPSDRERIESALAALDREVAPFWRDVELHRRNLTDLPESGFGSPRAKDVAPHETREDMPAREALEKQKAPAPARIALKADLAPDPPVAEDPASAYEVLQSLNVGARKRAERREQIADAEASAFAAIGEVRGDVYESEFRDELDANAERAGESIDALAASSPAPSAPAPPGSASGTPALHRADALPEQSRPTEEEATARALRPRDAGSSPPIAASAQPRAPAPRSDRSSDPGAERVRVTLEPMIGRPIGEEYLLLFRTVVIDGEGFRQGLLIDRRALGRWLADQVIGVGPLAGLASVRFDPGDSPLPAQTAHVAFHPFAEPFSGLEAELGVAPLGDTDSATTIYLLAALLAVVATLGLGSVHRMAAVVIDFAERRSNFVAAVSHELKTPLTAIRMHGEMLRDGLVPDEARRHDYYRTITDESERLSRLIDNVLEFSRLDKGGRTLAVVVGSPAPIVTDIVERLRAHAERAGFTLTTEVDGALPSVRFDRDALIQMIFNLVDNAIKYAAGAARREIVVRCSATGTGGVELTVRDFGPGVPRDQLGRIFEPFHRIEDELTRSTKGSGIGLSLVKQLGEAMGASVRGDIPDGGGFEVRIGLTPAHPS